MAVALWGVSSLQAAVILPGVGTLDIDFRDASWNVPSGVNSFSVGGITATAKPKAADLTRDIISGLGVDGNGQGNPDIPNEIDINEQLELLFLSGSGLGLSGVWLANLFPEPEGGSTLLVLGMALVGLAGMTSYQRRLAM